MHIQECYPRVKDVENLFDRDCAFFLPAFRRVAATFGIGWQERFEETLTRLFPPEQLAHAVRGYSEFAMDALRLHRRFETTGVYESKTYDEASAEVYHNADYMNDIYLPGILLSHFLWPHHYRQRLFFESAFLAEMKFSKDVSFAECGTGTGYYSRIVLDSIPSSRCIGFDISPASAEFTRRQWRAFGVDGRAELELRDILRDRPADRQVSWLVSVEVLEHLEDPGAFLRALRQLLKPGGKAFITAALNAPNADHIYFYGHPDDVGKQLDAAGFTVEQCLLASAYPPRARGVPVPEAVAFIVT